jgi:hypothetical protein
MWCPHAVVRFIFAKLLIAQTEEKWRKKLKNFRDVMSISVSLAHFYFNIFFFFFFYISDWFNFMSFLLSSSNIYWKKYFFMFHFFLFFAHDCYEIFVSHTLPWPFGFNFNKNLLTCAIVPVYCVDYFFFLFRFLLWYGEMGLEARKLLYLVICEGDPVTLYIILNSTIFVSSYMYLYGRIKYS